MPSSFRRLVTASLIAIALPFGALVTATSAAAQARIPVTGHLTLAVMPPMSSSGTFQIRNWKAAGKCIGISNTWAGSWYCTTSPDQTWHWAPSPVSDFRRLINGNGQCLGVDGASTAEGARIRAWACNNNGDQYWILAFTPIGNAYYLYNYLSKLVIGILNASTANGAELIQWAHNYNGDQYWYLPVD